MVRAPHVATGQWEVYSVSGRGDCEWCYQPLNSWEAHWNSQLVSTVSHPRTCDEQKFLLIEVLNGKLFFCFISWSWVRLLHGDAHSSGSTLTWTESNYLVYLGFLKCVLSVILNISGFFFFKTRRWEVKCIKCDVYLGHNYKVSFLACLHSLQIWFYVLSLLSAVNKWMAERTAKQLREWSHVVLLKGCLPLQNGSWSGFLLWTW